MLPPAPVGVATINRKFARSRVHNWEGTNPEIISPVYIPLKCAKGKGVLRYYPRNYPEIDPNSIDSIYLEFRNECIAQHGQAHHQSDYRG